MHSISKLVVLVEIFLIFSCGNSYDANDDKYDDINVVELAYSHLLPLEIEGVTEEIPGTTEDIIIETTTEQFLPAHPERKESPGFSLPYENGQEINLDDIKVYEVNSTTPSKYMLIVAYDIFGFHPHVKYIADRLAENGFTVAIPDLFHGNATKIEGFPQPEFPERAKVIFSNEFLNTNKEDLLKIINHYKSNLGYNKFGMFGFCWGGKVTVSAASDTRFDDLSAIGLVHPSRVSNEEGLKIRVPAILLPSSAEPDMLPMLSILNSNATVLSEHYRFGNMHHGFAGARSDFSNDKVRHSVDHVILRLSKFFKKVFDASNNLV